MRELPPDWIVPDWPVPTRVKAFVTTRNGGASAGPYASFNLGLRVNDDPQTVGRNRALLREYLPAEPRWLVQVHGNLVVSADSVRQPVEADAATSRSPDTVCAIMVADCMPVLLADREGAAIAIAHAGWRGLAAGVVDNAVRALAIAPGRVVAWLGPAIGPDAFEVGADVRDAFVAADASADTAFRPKSHGKWLADLAALARQRLAHCGVHDVHGGGVCTWSTPARFFSYRRDGETGRMAALLWLE
ncbi:MAG TPA: peptidoglycan editing factor PgeF [Casimicrobiaceae bacterium]